MNLIIILGFFFEFLFVFVCSLVCFKGKGYYSFSFY